MLEAIKDAGPPALTLLIVLMACIAYGKAPEIREWWVDFWKSVLWDEK